MKNKTRKAKTESNTEVEISKIFSLKDIKFRFHLKTKSQQKFFNLIKEKDIVICKGPAGCGKTYVSLLQALELLIKPESVYKKILFVKSVTTLDSEEIGFLKGNVKEKMQPFMESYKDNIEKIINKDICTKLVDSGIIEVLPIAYIRGRSIDNSIILIDEAQNISINNMRTIMTRLGDNSKLVIMGDTKQIDLKRKETSSLEKISKMFEELIEIGIVEFEKKDIVRNPLIQKIEDIFDKYM